MKESKVEGRLRRKISSLGGKALKFETRSEVGNPDRAVLLPGGKICFVELKAPGENPRKIQEYRIAELKRLGFDVRVLDTLEKVDEFIEEVKNGIYTA